MENLTIDQKAVLVIAMKKRQAEFNEKWQTELELVKGYIDDLKKPSQRKRYFKSELGTLTLTPKSRKSSTINADCMIELKKLANDNNLIIQYNKPSKYKELSITLND